MKHTNSEQELEKKVRKIVKEAFSDGSFWRDDKVGSIDLVKKAAKFDIKERIDQLMQLIQSEREKVLKELKSQVIGEDEEMEKVKPKFTTKTNEFWFRYTTIRNDLRAEQRKKLAKLAQKEE